MRWVDRLILVFVGAGLWLAVGAYAFHERYAVALDLDDIADDVVQIVEASCSVHGEVYMYDESYGEIESGRLSC